MIDKSVQEICRSDLESLVENGVSEGKRLEFKREFYRLDSTNPGDRDRQRREILKDISAFANCSGGDLLIGVEESQGKAIRISGFSPSNGADNLKLRIHELAQRGLQPRVPFSLHHVDIDEENIVLVVRIERSRIGPHRIVLNGEQGQFWSRNSGGAYEMDVDDLRQAFNSSAILEDLVSEFRHSRVEAIANGEAMVALLRKACLVCHLIPIDAFSNRIDISPSEVNRVLNFLPMIQRDGCAPMIDEYGVTIVAERNNTPKFGYLNIQRNGVIEAVDTGVVHFRNGDESTTPLFTYPLIREVGLRIKDYLKAYEVLGVSTPILCGISLTGISGMLIAHFDRQMYGREISSSEIELPLVELSDPTPGKIGLALRPAFDRLWNAAGFANCPLISDDGAISSQ
ncbi:ATP-binding protein [Bremerella sp. JC770]|uniref:AlbA family DNA-binding domain-containing protein n=1 Tax=Bremerella sp. JC770 TaxID=3232137 RepID=UPI003457AE78